MTKVSFPHDDFYDDDVLDVELGIDDVTYERTVKVKLDPDAGSLPNVGDWAIITLDGSDGDTERIDGEVDECGDGRTMANAPDVLAVLVTE